MLESNLNAVNNDVKALVTDAQALFTAAATLSGVKAEEMRKRGMDMLDAALLDAKEAQTCALVTGKKIVSSADTYVKDNPWQVIGGAAVLGILATVILTRK